jgi:outer membrane receptor for Fe3+-dicitrate
VAATARHSPRRLALSYLQSQQVKAAVLGFGPDTVFSWDIQNRAKAQAYLAEARLTAGNFLCVVPRLRYTPYHKEYRFEPTAGDPARLVRG